MDGRPGTPGESARTVPGARPGSLARRRLLVTAAAIIAVAATDPAAARRSQRRRRGRGRGRSCHHGIQQWFAVLAERAPEGDGDGGEVSVDASGGSIVYGDIGPNADVRLSASGGQRVADASGGDGHVDLPPDFEAAGQDCVDRRRERRRRRRRRRRR